MPHLTPTTTNDRSRIADQSGDARVAESPLIARVLVPCSGMPNAEGALLVARELAERTGASVEMLAVFEPRIPPPLVARELPTVSQCEEPDRRSAADLLRRVRRQRRRFAPSARWPMRFEVGYAPFVIAQVARQTKADVIVLGIGRENPDARRLGSETALRVSHYGEVPVLAVARDAPCPLRKALFVAEGATKAVALRVALAVLGRPARLWISYPYDAFEAAPGVSGAANRQAFEKEISIPADVRLEHTDADAGDATSLIGFAHEHEVDLIVMPVRGKSLDERQLISNIVVPILRASRCSVLAVPERQNGRSTGSQRPPNGLSASNSPLISA